MSGGLRFDLSGLRFEHLLAAAERGGGEGIRLALEHIGEVSAQQVPVEEGTLLRSQRIEGGTSEGSISYHTVYARYQHERMDLHHEHGNAKYLEIPFTTEEREALDIIAASIRRAL